MLGHYTAPQPLQALTEVHADRSDLPRAFSAPTPVCSPHSPCLFEVHTPEHLLILLAVCMHHMLMFYLCAGIH